MSRFPKPRQFQIHRFRNLLFFSGDDQFCLPTAWLLREVIRGDGEEFVGLRSLQESTVNRVLRLLLNSSWPETFSGHVIVVADCLRANDQLTVTEIDHSPFHNGRC